ncbi:ATP-NAD kinase family protein [Oceanicoccus sagamiensis]|uniref:ATP-NAD kinase n=1 Tax=Oceanicoccus sagamiensis TaxID=716816 RepID=A0A1X9NJ77_9GAMM|nr:ATP-NAD kinase family protein [Oceanicoccus sagamiensis]ARN75895.1 ATP-NAD kinase [Oceanicoccus sagamiensis]
MFKLGLIINPLAGIGGPLALKGSDGEAIVAAAKSRGAQPRAPQRAIEALKAIDKPNLVTVYGFAGEMGGDIALAAGLAFEAIGESSTPSSAEDTIAAARVLQQQGVDLILFAGGDGTARDIFAAVAGDFPVLGIPAGVKMHSGVYAVSPQAAGEIVRRLINGQLIDIGLAEVRDIDEARFRQGVVSSRFFGELLVPKEGRFLQQVKSSGREVEALVLQDIAADIVESMEDDCLYIIGPGTTPRAVLDELQLENTLLGFDAVVNNELLGADLDESALFALVEQYPLVKVIITAIGGQGHIIGRGNQQLSPRIIRAVGLDNLMIVATKTKITELEGRPLQVDSNDPELDQSLSGYRQIITGYHDAIMYPVGLASEEESQ